MRWVETKSVRRLWLRLERGEAVHASLQALAREQGITAAAVTGIGAFEWVSLLEYDQQREVYKEPRRFEGGCEILSLVGNLSIKDGQPFAHVHVAISRETDNGIEVLGGHLADACVFAAELLIDCTDDVALARAPDPATGLSLWANMTASQGGVPAGPGGARRAEPSAPASAASAASARASVASAASARASAPSAPSVGWAQVAELSAASSAAERPERPAGPPVPARAGRVGAETRWAASDEEPIPERGDWVDHKQFGLCRVDGEDAEASLIIRLPSGQRKAIKLDVLEVLPPRMDGDRRIYPLRPRQRR